MPIIGREEPADIVIPIPQVSARHAEIRCLGNNLYELIDLNSSNGTFVNGVRIQSQTIRLSDDIRFGSFRVDLSAYRQLIPLAPEPVIAPGKTEGSSVAVSLPEPAAKEIERVPEAPQAQPPAADQSALPPADQTAPEPAPAKETPIVSSPEPREPQRWAQPGMGTELAAALAAQKSYVGKAFLTMFLYYLLWLPGMIMNIVYWSEAKRVRQITGESPSGMGCLLFLLITHLILPACGLLILLITGGAILKEFLDMF